MIHKSNKILTKKGRYSIVEYWSNGDLTIAHQKTGEIVKTTQAQILTMIGKKQCKIIP